MSYILDLLSCCQHRYICIDKRLQTKVIYTGVELNALLKNTIKIQKSATHFERTLSFYIKHEKTLNIKNSVNISFCLS